MKKEIKIIIALLMIIILTGAVCFLVRNQNNRTKKNDCIKRCNYGNIYGSLSDKKEMVWGFDVSFDTFDVNKFIEQRKNGTVNHIFETREQCLDYCMIIK